jgi:hypothetical protein
MTSLLEEKQKLTSKPLAFKRAIPSHPLMTRDKPIIGNNPKGLGIVKNNVIVRTKRASLRKAYA